MNTRFAQLVLLCALVTSFTLARLDAAQEGTIIKIKTAEELNNYIGKGKFVVLYFGSLTCGPCKTFHPIYEELARENSDVVFLEVTYGVVPNCEFLLNKYAVRAFPTFIFFDKEGKKTNSFSGGSERTKGKIEQEIALLKTGKSKQTMVVSEVQPQGARPPQQPSQQQVQQPSAQQAPQMTQPQQNAACATQPQAQPMQKMQPARSARPTPSPKRKQVRRPRQQSKEVD